MDDVKLELITTILDFLKAEFRAGYLDSENAEGLEVAIHCLENIYDVSRIRRIGNVPNLMEVYRAFRSTHVGCMPKLEATEEEKAEAERLKVEGNLAMSGGRYTEALEFYSSAIDYNPKNAVYYCNRAAALSKIGDHSAAVKDCQKAIELDPKYSKAYGRLGLAYCGLENYVSALENYKKAHDLEPENEGYRRNYELAQQKVAQLFACPHHGPPGTSGGMGVNFNINAPANTRSSSTPDAPQVALDQMDLTSLFGNPQLVTIASQMLADPNMQNMMSSILNQDSGNGMAALLQAGQSLARQMQTENPAIFQQLRQSFTNPANPRDGNNQPDSGQDGGDSSHEKQQ